MQQTPLNPLQPYNGTMSNSIGVKRSRSTSPGAQHKRRVPNDFQPAMYGTMPGMTRFPPHGSGKSTPGGSADFIHRTEELHLNTPPDLSNTTISTQSGYGWDSNQSHADAATGLGGGQDMDMDAMDADDAHPAQAQPRSAVDFLHHSHPRFSHSSHHNTVESVLPPHAPHHAPPLHLNLAGSPHATGMSRSSSSSSDSSLSLSPHHMRNPPSFLHQQQLPSQPQLTSTPQDAPMPPNPQRRQGGWRITFGYRPDCQKCLDRVPGHYSHVVHDNPASQEGNAAPADAVRRT